MVVTESTWMMQAVFEMTPAEQVECKASQSLRVGLPILIARTARPECAASLVVYTSPSLLRVTSRAVHERWNSEARQSVGSVRLVTGSDDGYLKTAGIAMLWDSWWNVWRGRSLPQRRRVGRC